MFKKSAKKEPNDSKEAKNNALVLQDPRMKVRTATAHSETTNTTEKSATIFDNENNKMTHQTVRQTVTNQKTARVTEISIRRTPTKEELAELLMTSGPFPNFTNPTSWTKQETTVTQTNGGTQTSFLQQQKMKFQQSTGTTMGSGASWRDFTSSKPTTTTLNVHVDNYAPQSMLRALPALPSSAPPTGSSLIKPIRSTTTTSVSPLANSYSRSTTTTSVSPLANSYSRSTTTTSASPLTNSYSRSQSGSGSKLAISKIGTSSSDTSIASKRAAFFNTNKPATTITSTFSNSKLTTTISPSTNVSPYGNSAHRPRDAISYTKPTTTTSSMYLSPLLTSTKPLTTKPLSQSSSFTPAIKSPTQTLSLPQKSLSACAVQVKSNLKPGYAVIFNTVDFADKTRFDKRDGSDYDAKLIKETLLKYKLNVDTKKNPTVNNIKDTIRKLTTKNFKNYSCLVIVILSHGSANDSIAATDGVYNLNEVILYPILDIPTLKDKPKIFIIQACKGDLVPGEYKTDAYTTRGPPTEILKCYSTFEGYVSYRTDSGSPFVQALCDEIKLKGDNTNIEQLMKNAIATVKTKTGSKQVPSMTTTLTKPFVFGDYV
ncbi:mucin-5AC [Bactrocera dorsalis]|uniref:Mucin-5AC n=1 Tax=Bactrocera dorsalis TaxID=27457 RepID=A0ABM3JGV7_BACDO|nr:mucin-5AC [Bactrocera dorsalis]